MERIFVSNIKINKVRHLKDIEIPLSDQEMRHLLITGKNGSGKTSLLEAIATFLDSISNKNDLTSLIKYKKMDESNLDRLINNSAEIDEINETKERILWRDKKIAEITGGVSLEMNQSFSAIHSLFGQGKFVVAYYQADRIFKAQVPKHVEKVELKNGYTIKQTPREDFIKYLLDLKMTQALAVVNKKGEKAEKIEKWFVNLENLLKKIFENDSVRLEFDEDTFEFEIHMDGREAFDFNTLSSGYAAVLDIVVDLIIRMEKQTNRSFDFSIPGIVLVDEIETHLHLELQKKILGLLTTVFPNVQFIISTHSPFILNSLEKVTIYDLENHTIVKHGLADVPYSGIVEGYFNADEMSMILKEKYEKYKKLVNKSELTDEDFEEIADLEMYLEEIPDYLALNVTTEYQRLKAVLRKREDI